MSNPEWARIRLDRNEAKAKRIAAEEAARNRKSPPRLPPDPPQEDPYTRAHPQEDVRLVELNRPANVEVPPHVNDLPCDCDFCQSGDYVAGV